MNWFRKLLGLCQHKWETVDTWVITRDGRAVGQRHILRCEHCGWVKHRNLY